MPCMCILRTDYASYVMRQNGGQAISEEFNSQSDANTLWAFATMGRKPAERIMGQLERQAEAISDLKHEILVWVE